MRHKAFWLFVTVACSAMLHAEENPTGLPGDVRRILAKADRFEVLSLEPDGREWTTLGRAEVGDRAEQKAIVDAVEKGIAEGTGGAICFTPRHGIHATYKGKSVDVLICFECSVVVVEVNGKFRKPRLPTSRASQAVLDAVLRKAGVRQVLEPRRDE